MHITQDPNTGKVTAQLTSLGQDFAGGLNEKENIGLDQSPGLLNVYCDDDGTLLPRPMRAPGSTQSFIAKRAFSYNATDNIERCAITNNTKVFISTNMETFSEVPDFLGTGDLTLNPLYDTRMTSYRGYLFGTNGSDEVWYWTGGASSTDTGYFGAGNYPRYLATYKDRIFFLNTPTYPDGLFWTDLGGLTMDPLNSLPVRSNGSGDGSGLAVCRRGLIVFKNDSCWLLTGYSNETFNLTPISDRKGCINADSIQELNGWIIFLGHDGFYKTDGVNLIPIPDFIIKTRKDISQVYKWNLFNDLITGVFWESKIDSAYVGPGGEQNNRYIHKQVQVIRGVSYSDFIPTIYYEFNKLYNPTIGVGAIHNGGFTSGDDRWTHTNINSNYTWNFTNNSAKMRFNKNIQTSYFNTFGYFKWRLYNIDTGDTLKEGIQNLNLTLSQGPISGTIQTDISTLPPKYRYTRAKFQIEVYHQPLSRGLTQDILAGTLESDPFIIYSSTSGMFSEGGFSWERLFWLGGPVNPDIGAENFGGVKFTSFYGKRVFQTLDYFSKVLPIKAGEWGPLTYDIKDHNEEETGTPYDTKEIYIDFSDDGGATWSGFQGPVGNGESIASYDPNSPGDTNAIRIWIKVRHATTVDYPVQINSVSYSWFDRTENIPKSLDNVTSVIWDNRYILGFTKPGEEQNFYAITYDEISGKPRFFKWFYDTGCASFVYYGNKVWVVGNNHTAGQCSINMFAEKEYFRNSMKDTFYFTKEFDIGKDGVLKDFDSIIMASEAKGEFYNQDEMKIEVWIDGKYNGDLDTWLRKLSSGPYFAFKHTTLRQHEAEFSTDNLTCKIPVGYPSAHSFWPSPLVPIGFGNKIQFRIYYGTPTGNPLALQTNNAKLILKTLAFDMYINEDAFLEPGLNLFEGGF